MSRRPRLFRRASPLPATWPHQGPAAGPRGAGRLVAAARRFHGEGGHAVGPAQAMAVHALCSDPSLGRAWLLTEGRRDIGYALACWRHSIDHGGRAAVLDD